MRLGKGEVGIQPEVKSETTLCKSRIRGYTEGR
jgi:hypothetical protein